MQIMWHTCLIRHSNSSRCSTALLIISERRIWATDLFSGSCGTRAQVANNYIILVDTIRNHSSVKINTLITHY